MAYPGFIKTGTREKLMDIVLWEQISSNGFSREELEPKADTDYTIGDLLTADGSIATKAADIFGVCLNNYSAKVGLTTSGQVNLTVIARQAELKAGGINLGTLTEADVKAALAAKGIALVPTGK